MPNRQVIQSSSLESEIALIIKADPVHIRSEIAGIRRILDYDLKFKPSQVIHDAYYDTKANFLRERRISLRIRRMDDTLLISTKSDIRRVAGNLIQRREMEGTWSYNSIRQLARNLKLKVPTMSVSQFKRISVSKALAAFGLSIIQERRTQRNARNIMIRGKTPTPILAELAIDYVTYIFGDTKVGLSEIEIEAKAPRALGRVREIADAFVLRYQPSLEQWFHGKFVTGLAMQRLLKTRALQNHLVHGEVDADAFELIDRAIRSRRF